VDAYYDPDPEASGKIYTRFGGFLEGIDQFDPQFFGIAPREAMSMDPQQRLLLEIVWEVLEHAGIAAERLRRSRSSVYVGVGANEYAGLISQGGEAAIDAYFSTGNALNVIAGRVAHALGLQGPAMAVDTACSSSLVAVHLACQTLRSGESDLALACGVNVLLSPHGMIATSKARMLSADGRCKTFDASADGYVRSEGCGAVVLKRLSDAVRDGDRVLAVIRGSAVNQDGRTSGLTVPNGPAQERVIRDALGRAGVAPHEVDYLEAHGTGTALGDPIEVQAAAAALGEGRAAGRPLLIGSVKANIGHLEAASGIAGLIKVVLAMGRGVIPGQLHFSRPSPHIPWDRLPVRVADRATPWPNGAGGRRPIAGVSSFGFSGTNAHVVLEGPPPSRRPRRGDRDRMVVGSTCWRCRGVARSRCVSSRAVTRRGCGVTRCGPRGRVLHGRGGSLAHGASRGGGGQVGGGGVVGRCWRWRRVVRVPVCGRAAVRVRRWRGCSAERGRSTGGWRGVCTSRSRRSARLSTSARRRRPASWTARCWMCSSVAERRAARCWRRRVYSQPALFALEVGLARLYRGWGLEPDAVLGHGVGEYAAACVAGVLSVGDGIRLVSRRGRLMGELASGGRMASVFAPGDRVASAVSGERSLSVAAYNGGHAVISGPAGAVEAVVERFRSEGVRCEDLPGGYAFHSALVDPILERLEAAAGDVEHRPAERLLLSSVTGEAIAAGRVLDGTYWRRQAREPVEFARGVRSLSELGCTVLLELGPHPVLGGWRRRAGPATVPPWRSRRCAGACRTAGSWPSRWRGCTRRV